MTDVLIGWGVLTIYFPVLLTGYTSRGSAHLQRLRQGLGKQPLSWNRYVKSEVTETIPGPGPREGSLTSSWCCSLPCTLSNLHLGSTNLHWDSKIRRYLHWDDGATYPSQQPESAPFRTLVLSWRLCHTKALALFPSVKQLLLYTELTLQQLLGLYGSAKPSHRGCWVKMSCSHLDWKVLFLPKETFIHEEHEWCYILHLTSLTDLLKLVFPGVMDTILYSYTPHWDRKELLYFPIKPSRRRSKPINCFETYFWKGIKWKEFPNLSWMEHYQEHW